MVSRATLRCGPRASHAVASRCRAQALGGQASVVMVTGFRELPALFLRSTWDLPGPGIKPE